ncbi:MAG: hypothetical protein GY855_11345, partial [candidate division Zixibacteria bacterium]|nr:hypothetical protein [candidate division Zixibacteria bacterium]
MSFDQNAINKTVELLKNGDIPPWKAESYLTDEYNLSPPDNYFHAAVIRRSFLEEISDEKFKYLPLPEKPYLVNYYCEKCNIDYQLAGYDEVTSCSICGEKLNISNPLKTFPLTANYIGGIDDYFSYCGNFKVKGDITKEFIGILQYGTGLGPIGVTRGGFFINKYGGAEVTVTDTARACRNLGYIFDNTDRRLKALKMIESYLPEIRTKMN